MLYIHQTSCISPQQTFSTLAVDVLQDAVAGKLQVIEPAYEGIPPGILRRMGKAVRIGVGAALPLLKQLPPPNGIIIGTANGGMEDCIKFLNQLIQYEEGLLTPGNFVQSTPNAIAGQLGLLSANKGYNITHGHRGLAFENAVIDAVMLLQENPLHSYLLGAVDEISTYNYNIEYLGGWYKKEATGNHNLYATNTWGSMAGEGAAMFLVNARQQNAVAQLQAITTLHSPVVAVVQQHLQQFLQQHLPGDEQVDVFLSGENGDERLLPYYNACETIADGNCTIARFKHMSGEYPTASSFAGWLACHLLQTQAMPQHMVKKQGATKEIKQVLVYNNYKGLQHSFMLLKKV